MVPTEQQTALRVLLADDDDSVRFMLQAALERDMLADLIYRSRLTMEPKAEVSIAAREHGDLRRNKGYTAATVVEESRIFQVSLFNTLQNTLARVDFSKVLLDVMTIADEVDSQLKQAMLSYVEPTTPSWSAA
jgi:hypothetical protein